MDTNAFHETLDALYAAGDVSGAYDFLCARRAEALENGDLALLLTADNALVGHCRENVRFDEVEGYYREAADCLARMGLKGTQAEAATLLNAATAYCVMGRFDESGRLYDDAEALYQNLLTDDVEMAAFYNNRGLLLRAQGKTGEAYVQFNKALTILMRCEDVEAERAATLLNVASTTPLRPQAQTYLDVAMHYYETPEGQRDIHRFTAMATGAELVARMGDYAGAGARYEAAAEEWERAGLAPQRLKILLGNALACYKRARDAQAQSRVREKLEALA